MLIDLVFFSKLNPPEPGDTVVCYKKEHWLRVGVVTRVQNNTISNGTAGLKAGAEGTWVTILEDGTCFSTFRCWAAYLAPLSYQNRVYSEVCRTDEFMASHFCSLYACVSSPKGVTDYRVTKEEARESLNVWLHGLGSEDEHEVPPEVIDELLQIFDQHQDASLHLYSKQHILNTSQRRGPLGNMFMKDKSNDYSLYYLALNNNLNHDSLTDLQNVMPLIRHMVFLLLFDEDTGWKRRHQGGPVYKGDVDCPSRGSMEKLVTALETKQVIRFRQFQSTSKSKSVASKFQKRADTPGFTWTIDIAEGFWGARDISDVAKTRSEAETLFPPYAAFKVKSVESRSCHLEAVDVADDPVWEDIISRLHPFTTTASFRLATFRNYRSSSKNIWSQCLPCA